MELKKLDYALTVCKVAAECDIDLNKDFYFVGKTDEEYSLVCITEDCIAISSDSSVTPTQVMDALDAEGIETRPIWKPMHLQPVFEKYDFIQAKDGMNVSEDIFNRGLCLPSDIKNTKEDMERIIKIVRKQFRQ